MLKRLKASMTIRVAALFCSATVPRALIVMVIRMRPAKYQRCYQGERQNESTSRQKGHLHPFR